MYSATILDHFHHPRNAGELAEATAVAEVSNPVCGDVLKLSVAGHEGFIARARFKAQGCVPAVASGSWLAEMMEGKHADELRALTAEQVENALGGLPPASRHAVTLAIDALGKILSQL